jgi:hypothetical protein
MSEAAAGAGCVVMALLVAAPFVWLGIVLKMSNRR